MLYLTMFVYEHNHSFTECGWKINTQLHTTAR